MKAILLTATAIIALSASAAMVRADTIMRCNDAGDLCVMRKTPGYGSFDNPIEDDYPDEYRPGYLHSGVYCAAGNCHRGYLKPWERSPIIKRSCGR
jgi:hypothetical protein